MENQIQKTAKALNELSPFEITKDVRVQHKFVDIFNIVHGRKNGNMVYETESFHFQKAISENKALQECTALSLYGCFIDVAVQNLSFDPTKKLCYLVPYSAKNAQGAWEKRANLQISPYGELALRIACGQIKRADNPVMVFEGEQFELMSTDSGKTIKHQIKFPRPEKPIACYIKLVKPDDNVDYFVLDLPGMQRLSGYSAKKNGERGANALFTSGPDGTPDIGFWQAKTIKHAFQSYPKVNLRGANTVLESETEEAETMQAIDYSIEESTPSRSAYAEPAIESRATPIQPMQQTHETIRMTSQPDNSIQQASAIPVTETEDMF